MIIDILETLSIILVSFIVGYLIGRRERNILMQEDEEYQETAGEQMADKKKHKKTENSVRREKVICSPVDGIVHSFCEGGRKGAVIEPKQGMIYAPASGKIVKLYPMGNAFVLRSDEQSDILIQVGRQCQDELCSMYYRTRIVQNEVVNKGKLLLTFDMEKLKAAGEEITVSVSLEERFCDGEITVEQKESVKVGEELITIA